MQATLRDFESTPRRLVLLSWLWLSDVNAERAPFLYIPGSHKLIGKHWEEKYSSGLHAQLPRCKGVFQDSESISAPWQEALEGIPDSEFGQPRKLTARRGQLSLISTSMLHSGSCNQDSVPRKFINISWTARGVSVGMLPHQFKARQSLVDAFRSAVDVVCPGRAVSALYRFP